MLAKAKRFITIMERRKTNLKVAKQYLKDSSGRTVAKSIIRVSS